MYNHEVMMDTLGDGSHVATMPAIPGCIGCGDTAQEALSRLMTVYYSHIDSLRQQNEPLPPTVADRVRDAGRIITPARVARAVKRLRVLVESGRSVEDLWAGRLPRLDVRAIAVVAVALRHDAWGWRPYYLYPARRIGFMDSADRWVATLSPKNMLRLLDVATKLQPLVCLSSTSESPRSAADSPETEL